MLENNNRIRSILILGGYGNAGRCIAQHLVRETAATTDAIMSKSIHIIIAGRDEAQAKQLAEQLGEKYNCSNRIHWLRVDATDLKSLDQALSSPLSKVDDDNGHDDDAGIAAAVDMLVVASSTTSSAKQVAEAALRHHVSYYFDIQISSPSKLRDLMALEPQIRAANKNGCLFVTDGGVHPGVPGALVRYAQAMAKEEDHSANGTTMAVQSANVYMLFRPNWKGYKFSPASQQEFIEEACEMPPMLYRNGAWIETGWTYAPAFDFGPPFGKHICMPMYLQELKNITDAEDMMQELGVYVTGFNWFTDYIVLSLAVLVFYFFPKSLARWLAPMMARLFQWSLTTFSKPPYGGKLVMEAVIGSSKYQEQQQPNENSDKGDNYKTRLVRLELTHDDVYEATAIPAVATILQMLDYNDKSSPPPSGLQYQAQLVEPRRFLKDMQRLGMEIKEEIRDQ